MLRFFRNIRRRLLDSGSLRKYLVYAVGEILLVVIGILIALQINNWNEARKEKTNEKVYLKGIKKDIEQDLEFVQERIDQYSERLSMYSNLDTVFVSNLSDNNNPTLLSRRFDANQRIYCQDLFGRLLNFRLKGGTYHSLISNGDAKIIQNKELFNQFQQIYELDTQSLESTYGTIKNVELELGKKYASERLYFPYKYIRDVKDKALIADLYFFFDMLKIHYILLNKTNERMIQAIHSIEQELEK